MGAARDLREGELLLKVPKSVLMTKESLLLKDEKLSLSVNDYAHHSLSPTQVFLTRSFAVLITQLFVFDKIKFFYHFMLCRYWLFVYSMKWVKGRFHGGTLTL